MNNVVRSDVEGVLKFSSVEGFVCSFSALTGLYLGGNYAKKKVNHSRIHYCGPRAVIAATKGGKVVFVKVKCYDDSVVQLLENYIYTKQQGVILRLVNGGFTLEVT